LPVSDTEKVGPQTRDNKVTEKVMEKHPDQQSKEGAANDNDPNGIVMDGTKGREDDDHNTMIRNLLRTTMLDLVHKRGIHKTC